MNQVKQLFTRYKMLALVFAVAFIWLYFSWQTEGGFLTPRNLSNLLRQMSITGILACGMVLVIISGEIDLSVGSLLGLLGGVAAILDVVYHVPLLANLGLVALCGLLIGLANGYMAAYLRIPSFIVGLGGMLAFRGILLGITGGTTIAPVSPELVYIGQGYLPHIIGTGLGVLLFALTLFLTWKQRRNRALHGLAAHSLVRDVVRVLLIGAVLAGFVQTLNSYDGIPVPVLLLLVLLGGFSYVTSQTVFGRRVYSVGSNMEATRLSGINVQAVKLWIFGIMGVMCALAGVVNTARLAAGSPSAGSMGELDAIAACFIGGTSMRGGSGTVYGALLGALVITSLDNGMSMLDVDSYWQMIVKGSILVLAVWVDVSTRTGRR
ncbi:MULTISPECIES: sugar ABC transporter permease [Pseudomonas]|jgi:D-xylose transport system permease protein|uniref:Xylose transport system permease protein XylH n=1 Tax=Pseudomonas fluorescens NCIMB 11764 TaxID=1221522 RepID=A0A0K1QVL7_PSEFL|nr:sugar ABC transporter permease [Pseudomonas fluorescens]AKV09510.1 D-xylose ABC transporter permease [Pseudomonas fluorescens NCIMB 11764]